VTTLRTSRVDGASGSEAPQRPQNRNPSGFSWPHEGQRTTRIYSVATRRSWFAAGEQDREFRAAVP
jgi:hypothetical protein